MNPFSLKLLFVGIFHNSKKKNEIRRGSISKFSLPYRKKMPGFNVCILVSIAFLIAVKNYLMEDFNKKGFVLAHNLRGQSS